MPLLPRLRPGLALLALAAGACSRDNPRAAAGLPEGATALSAAPAAAPRLDSATVGFATRHHRLTMAQMTQWTGVMKRLQARAARDSSFGLRLGYSPDSSLESQARAVAETPALREALDGSGLSSRDWVVVTMAYIGASMAAQSANAAHSLAPDVNPENVAFVRRHKSEIDGLQRR